MAASITCLLAFCLIAEGESRRCAPATEPDVVTVTARAIGHAETADLPAKGWTSVEYRACARIAAETVPLINHRLTRFELSRTPSRYEAHK